MGFLLSCYVHKANDQDCHGCMKLFSRLTVPASKSLEKIIGDMGYRGPMLREEALHSHGIAFETIDRKEYGTNMVHKRWIVERSFAWLNHYRRLSRDYEKSCPQSEAMIFISQIQLLLRRALKQNPPRSRYKSPLLQLFFGLFRHPPADARSVKS